MKFIIIIFCTFLFYISPLDAYTKKLPWLKSIEKLRLHYSKLVKTKYEMYLEGVGSNRKEEIIKSIFFSYCVTGDFEVGDVRQLYIESTNLLLTLLNESPYWRKFIVEYPFTIKNLEFFIRFTDVKGEWQSGEPIAAVWNKDDIIYYEVIVNDVFQTVHTETYEEAKNIVLNSMKDK